jgi:hypothetical protein
VVRAALGAVLRVTVVMIVDARTIPRLLEMVAIVRFQKIEPRGRVLIVARCSGYAAFATAGLASIAFTAWRGMTMNPTASKTSAKRSRSGPK